MSGLDAAPVLSQDGTCPALVGDAMALTGTACAQTARGEACYGHALIDTTFRDGAGRVFAVSGDTIPLVNLRSLVTRPANPADGSWGVALLKVQADLPDEGDTALTLVLFGDTEISAAPAQTPTRCQATTNSAVNIRWSPGEDQYLQTTVPAGVTIPIYAREDTGTWVATSYQGFSGWVSASLLNMTCDAAGLFNVLETLPEEYDPASPLWPDWVHTAASTYITAVDQLVYDQPMQAFTLRSGPERGCAEAPDGLLISAPEGMRAHVIVNGVELEFASAAFLNAQPDGAMAVTGLTGVVRVAAFGKTVTIPYGRRTTIPMTGLQASGLPTDPVDVHDFPAEYGLFRTVVYQEPLNLAPALALTPSAPLSGTWQIHHETSQIGPDCPPALAPYDYTDTIQFTQEGSSLTVAEAGGDPLTYQMTEPGVFHVETFRIDHGALTQMYVYSTLRVLGPDRFQLIWVNHDESHPSIMHEEWGNTYCHTVTMETATLVSE